MHRKNVSDIDEKNCCGCGSCKQKCPKNCIEMTQNQRGFLMPVVDENKCIQCGLCVKFCPQINDVSRSPVVKAYAAVSKDSKLLFGSTSGGAFGAISSQFIKDGGVVYGCAWEDDHTVSHIKVESINKLYLIQQSKYLQSNTSQVFLFIKKDIETGRKVLFSGTACQIAGLYQFLGKKYENLFTVEIACHGVPSPGLFQKYCSWLEKNEGSEIVKFQFRNKKKHKKGEHYKFSVLFANGKLKYYLSWEDPFYGSFLKGRILRATCYDCKYKNENRIGDLLLSDFWGIEREYKYFPSENGTSAIMIFSQKGMDLLNAVKDDLILQETTFDQIIKHNKSIVASSAFDSLQYVDSIDCDSEELFKKLRPKISLKKRLRNLLPEGIVTWIKKL